MTRVNYAEAVQRAATWARVLEEDPDIMWSLIGDVLKIVQSDGDDARVGRRPAADAMSFDDMWSTLFPERFSTDPLPVALAALVGDRRQGAFAELVPCTQAMLSQLLAGKKKASPQMMEALARAGGVTPAYFVEWRAHLLASAVESALIRSPRASAAAAKRLAQAATR